MIPTRAISVCLLCLLLSVCTLEGALGRSYVPVQDVITNGDFEAGPAVTASIRIDPGSDAIAGWKVIQGSIDICGIGWASIGGSHCLDLEGEASFGGVSQTIQTTHGQVYTVIFYMAGNPDGGPSVKKMRVTAADQSTERWFDCTGRSRDNLGWERHTWQFLAVGDETTLSFVSIEDGPGHCGALLDNVSVFPSGRSWSERVHNPRINVAPPGGNAACVEAALLLDKPIPISLSASVGDQKVVDVESITLSLDDGWLQARVAASVLSGPKGKWRLVVELVDQGKTALLRGETTFENSGIVKGAAMLEKRVLTIADLGRWKEDYAQARIRVSIENMP